MTDFRVGYARVSTAEQDLEAQLDALSKLGVARDRIYLDHGLTGKNRDRPGLREALAACHHGATLVVTKLDRLGRSLTDLRDIAAELEAKGATLNIGGSSHDPTNPTGRLLFSMLAMMAEFEGDLISQRTREGMAIAKRRGRLKGKQPKLTPKQDLAVLRRVDAGEETIEEIAANFNVSRSSAYRAVDRARAALRARNTGGDA